MCLTEGAQDAWLDYFVGNAENVIISTSIVFFLERDLPSESNSQLDDGYKFCGVPETCCNGDVRPAPLIMGRRGSAVDIVVVAPGTY